MVLKTGNEGHFNFWNASQTPREPTGVQSTARVSPLKCAETPAPTGHKGKLAPSVALRIVS